MIKMKVYFLIFFFFAAAQSFRLEGVEFEALPKPASFAKILGEEEFDEYLDYYLQKYYDHKRLNSERILKAGGCSVVVNGDLSEPQPVYVSGGKLKTSSGTTGILEFDTSEDVIINCGSGNTILHDTSGSQVSIETKISCKNGTIFTGSWLPTSGAIFQDITCKKHVYATETETGTCANGQGIYIDAGFEVDYTSHTFLRACFDQNNANAIFVEFDQTPENGIHQSGVARPGFLQGQWFPGLSVDGLYTQNNQKAAFDTILGTGLSSNYINATFFLARGHLAAKTDFVLAPGQRNTFTFINVAPQWQPFNAGNWETLESGLRDHIADLGISTKIYTGIHGVLQLKSSTGVYKNIYLSTSTNKIAVPMWFYKVAYEPATKKGTVYLGLNNPHVSLAEAKALAFCTDVCANNPNFSWLSWKSDDIGLGYSICCSVDDFRKTVTVLPSFTTSGLLY